MDSKANRNRGIVADVATAFIKALQTDTGMKTLETQQQLLLLTLYREAEVNQRELAERTGVEKSAAQRNVRRLGQGEFLMAPGATRKQHVPGLGWVEAYQDPNDNRYNKVRLTATGRARLDAIADEVTRLLA